MAMCQTTIHHNTEACLQNRSYPASAVGIAVLCRLLESESTGRAFSVVASSTADHRCVDGSADVPHGTEGKMKTDEQYVAEFDALFEKHLMWTDPRVMDMFRAEHGSLNEDDVVRLFNQRVKKKKNLA
jgi:hypothetical protein